MDNEILLLKTTERELFFFSYLSIYSEVRRPITEKFRADVMEAVNSGLSGVCEAYDRAVLTHG